MGRPLGILGFRWSSFRGKLTINYTLEAEITRVEDRIWEILGMITLEIKNMDLDLPKKPKKCFKIIKWAQILQVFKNPFNKNRRIWQRNKNCIFKMTKKTEKSKKLAKKQKNSNFNFNRAKLI